MRVPGSPHIDSYRIFRHGLEARLTERLQGLLDALAGEGRLTFQPRVSVAMPRAAAPTAEEEGVAFVTGGSLEEDLRPSLSVGQGVLDWPLGRIPTMTDRGSFIHLGIERCVIAQFSKSPGVVFSLKEVAETCFAGYRTVNRCLVEYAVGEVRPDHGVYLTFRKERAPKENAPIGILLPNKAKVPLKPFLLIAGFSSSEIVSIFEGYADEQELMEHDAPGSGAPDDAGSAEGDIARGIGLGRWVDEQRLGVSEADRARLREAIQGKLYASRMGRLGRAQLNRTIRRVAPGYAESSELLTKHDLAHLLRGFIMFCKNGTPADDPWSLSQLKVRLVGEHLSVAFDRWFRWLEKKIREAVAEGAGSIGAEDFLKILADANGKTLDETRFSRVVRDALFQFTLCQLISREQANFLEAAALTRRITFNGLSGIPIGHEREPRDLHWSHYGRLCPLDTPQSDDVGVTLSLTVGARVSDLGILEARCRKVEHQEGMVRIAEADTFVSPWDEEDLARGWIAFPDQRDALSRGEAVWAHKGSQVLKRVPTVQVAYIHADEASCYSLAANLIPYRAHSDSLRGVMTCSFLRQALPLRDATPPRLAAGFESASPESLPFGYGDRVDGRLAFGKELFVGYLPWKGWNFEDALVISESAAEALTSLHDVTVGSFRLRRSLDAQQQAFQRGGRQVAEIHQLDLTQYDERGIIRQGTIVGKGTPLVIEAEVYAGRRGDGTGDHLLHRDDAGRSGRVARVEAVDRAGRGAVLRITLHTERPAEVGDKLANRHGHKGVISRIFADQEMPYVMLNHGGAESDCCPCGETRSHLHLQVLINPLSVISRMNLGQLYETVEARSSRLTGLPAKVPCFDPVAGERDARRLEGEILVGEQYIMKLDHNAADKLHGRSRVAGAYSSLVQQPLQGRRLKGGQRMGEMEVWALMAHNASALMQEMLTLKSDNPRERTRLFHSIMHGDPLLASPELPEALRTWAACCYGLGLDLAIVDDNGKPRDPLVDGLSPNKDGLSPDNARVLKLSLLNEEVFLRTVSKGAVTTSIEKGQTLGYRFHPEGLESEQIFGPVQSFSCACGQYRWDGKGERARQRRCEKCRTLLVPAHHRRHRMGHITLACPVPNPYVLLTQSGPWLGLDLRAFLEGRPQFAFHRCDPQEAWEAVRDFFLAAADDSGPIRQALEAILGVPVTTGEMNVTPRAEPARGFEALRGLLIQLVREKDGYTADRFISQAKATYGETDKALKWASGFAAAVVEESGVYAIDFLVELLRRRAPAQCLTILPVVPPPLRQRIRIRNGRYRPHDLKKLYEEVVLANSALTEVLSLRESIDASQRQKYRDKRQALQVAVGRVMCNEMLRARDRARDWRSPGHPWYQSLSASLRGKSGLLIGHLLGKRVDYSGRAVIVPDPTLPLDKCRLPMGLALRLFRPQLIAVLRQKELQVAEHLVDRAIEGDNQAIADVTDPLARLVETSTVLLNRQPTLHRLGLLAFKPELHPGSTIMIPPLVTKGYNADFDGDQMAVYLPLTPEAVADAETMIPSKHLWHPASGRLTLSLEQDLALGAHLDGKGPKGVPAEQLEKAPSNGLIDQIEQMKSAAFDRATRAGVSMSMEDLRDLERQCNGHPTPEDTTTSIKRTIEGGSDRDLFTRILASGARGNWDIMNYLAGRMFKERERSNLVSGLEVGERFDLAAQGRKNLVDTKLGTAEGGSLTKDLVALAQDVWITQTDCGTMEGIALSALDTVWLMLDKVPRGRAGEVIRDHMTQGRICELIWDENGFGTFQHEASPPPDASDDVLSAWRQRIDRVLDEHPRRLPPRLVALRMQRHLNNEEAVTRLFRRLYGRVLAADVGERFSRGTCLDAEQARQLAELLCAQPTTRVLVRSPIACKVRGRGVCGVCYGLPITRGRWVEQWSVADCALKDTRVGILAAQAMGEPGTQMALRKKHVAGKGDRGLDPVISTDTVRDLLNPDGVVFKVLLETPDELRDTVDYIYRRNGAEISPIHFETLFRSARGFRPAWLAEAAAERFGDRIKGIHKVLVGAALKKAEDTLDGLKERAVLGAQLPH